MAAGAVRALAAFAFVRDGCAVAVGFACVEVCFAVASADVGSAGGACGGFGAAGPGLIGGAALGFIAEFAGAAGVVVLVAGLGLAGFFGASNGAIGLTEAGIAPIFGVEEVADFVGLAVVIARFGSV